MLTSAAVFWNTEIKNTPKITPYFRYIMVVLRVNYLFFNVSTEAGLQNKKYQSEKMLIKRNHLKGST